MNRILGIVLEMVLTAAIVCFLLVYLLRGQINGGTGVWDGMGQGGIPEENAEDYVMDESARAVVTARIPEVSCAFQQVRLNRVYGLAELFANDEGTDCYLALKDIALGEESVLARGDIVALAEVETPAAALYNAVSGELMFTRAGKYRVTLRVGTAYGRKPGKNVELEILVVSDSTLNRKTAGGG
jgi:hypothetical protein